MHSLDLAQDAIARISELFPGCVTEGRGDDGAPRLAVDFDRLRQELSGSIIEGPPERYHLNWPGKREALLTANTPIAKTLRPCREESVHFDTTRNLFVEGDNLDVLKLIQKAYLGQVKMIYIDPPYNTGNKFVYADDFADSANTFLWRTDQRDEQGNRLVIGPEAHGRFHANWLSMMFSRLKLSRNLLRPDGVIVVHIDENEYPNLEKVLAEIFGEANNLGTIVWDKRNPKGDAMGVAQQHELICLYCKDREVFKRACKFKRPKENANRMLARAKEIVAREGGATERARKDYRDWVKQQDLTGGEHAYNQIDDNGDVYRPVSMAWPNKKSAPDEYFQPLIHPVTGKPCPVPERGWRNPPSTMRGLLKSGQILFGADETIQPTRKYLLKDNLLENVPSLLYFGGSDDALLAELGIPFDNPKPVYVAKRLIQTICGDEGIVLDFFAGAATTAHAVLQLNVEDGADRRFIMVQWPEPCGKNSSAFRAGYESIAEIAKERLRRAAAKLVKANAQTLASRRTSLDWGFRVLKVGSSNMADVYYTPHAPDQARPALDADNIRPDRTSEDLLFQVMLDCGVDLALPIVRETVCGKDMLFVGNGALAACFDVDGSVDVGFAKELAKRKPLRVVFRGAGFGDSAARTKVAQVFKRMSPSTEVKSL
ncbi:MAG: site-specific DNA-methyltransferase [Acidiferrobacter sp.]